VAFGRSIPKLEEKGYVPEGVAQSYIDEIFAKKRAQGEPMETFSFLDYMIAEFDCVREYLIRELKNTAYPIEPLNCLGGYFVLVDVSKMREFIPKKYLESHEYEEDPKVNKI